MADGKWSAGKIILVIAAVLVGLGILCCGGLMIVAGDKILGVWHIGMDSAEFVQDLQNDFGKTAVFGLVPDENQQFILTIGVPDELTEERVADVQDKAWRAFSKAYGDHGFVTISSVAVGRPSGGSQGGQAHAVSDWRAHMIDAEALIARTGAAAPPKLSFIPDDMGGANVKVTVDTRDEPEENPSDESGGK